MLNSLPEDPEPTEAELQEELASMSDWPEDTRRGMAHIRWRAWMAQQDPDAFRVHFATQVPNYLLYQRSAEWEAIRSKVLDAANHRCACCSRKAKQVHHRDYRPRVLRGEDLTPLVAICGRCHKRVHNDEAGKKRGTWNECERVLAEMVAEDQAAKPKGRRTRAKSAADDR